MLPTWLRDSAEILQSPYSLAKHWLIICPTNDLNILEVSKTSIKLRWAAIRFCATEPLLQNHRLIIFQIVPRLCQALWSSLKLSPSRTSARSLVLGAPLAHDSVISTF